MKHPKFMTEELLDRIDSKPFDPETIAAVSAQTRRGLDYWSNTITETLGYLNALEAPIVIAAMWNITDEFEKQFDARETVEDIRDSFGYEALVRSKQIINPEDLK